MIIMHLYIILLVFLVHIESDFIIFIKLRKVLATISSNVVFCHTISLLPYVDTNYVHIPHKLDHLKLSHNSLMLFSFTFYFLYLPYFILDS